MHANTNKCRAVIDVIFLPFVLLCLSFVSVYIDAGAYFISDCHSNKSPLLVFIDSFIIAFSMRWFKITWEPAVYFGLWKPLNCGHHLDAYLCRLKLKSIFLSTLYADIDLFCCVLS